MSISIGLVSRRRVDVDVDGPLLLLFISHFRPSLSRALLWMFTLNKTLLFLSFFLFFYANIIKIIGIKFIALSRHCLHLIALHYELVGHFCSRTLHVFCCVIISNCIAGLQSYLNAYLKQVSHSKLISFYRSLVGHAGDVLMSRFFQELN